MNGGTVAGPLYRIVSGGHLPYARVLLNAFGRVLPRAGLYVRPEVYLSGLVTRTAAVLAVSLVAALGFQLLFGLPLAHAVVAWTHPFVLAAVVFALGVWSPWNRAAQRRRQIDSRLPFALNYISTMASAGMPADRIFWSLSKQAVYGEVAVEARLISRDLRGLGVDLRTAFRTAMDRTPSRRLAALLQGAITTLSTGEDLSEYFLAKSRQFSYENRQNERRFLESLGVLAESYVTLIVAAPIFMIILLSVMLVFGGSAEGMLMVGYVLVLVLIPTAQATFAAILESITPEV